MYWYINPKYILFLYIKYILNIYYIYSRITNNKFSYFLYNNMVFITDKIIKI